MKYAHVNITEADHKRDAIQPQSPLPLSIEDEKGVYTSPRKAMDMPHHVGETRDLASWLTAVWSGRR